MRHLFRLNAWLACALIAAGNVAAQAPATDRADADQPSAANQQASPRAPELEALGWLVGNWLDESPDSKIRTRCGWARHGKFLTRTFQVATGDDATVLEGTQVIGWDPALKQVRSWTFDSEGGIGEGLWTRDGNRWLVKTTHVLPDGKRASAVNVLTFVDRDTLRWRSTSREVGGEMMPNIPEVTVRRVKQKSAQTGTKGQ